MAVRYKQTADKTQVINSEIIDGQYARSGKEKQDFYNLQKALSEKNAAIALRRRIFSET